MNKSFNIVVTRPVKSRNQLDKMHWSKRNKERSAWQQAIKYEGFNGKVPKFQGKVHVVIYSTRPRLLDKDNLIGGCKPIFDALKQLGVIVDDKPQFLFSEVVQVKGKPNQTRIYMGEMPKSSGSTFTHPEIEEMLAEHSQQIHDDAPLIIRQLLDEIKGKKVAKITASNDGIFNIEGVGKVKAIGNVEISRKTKLVFSEKESFFIIEFGALLPEQADELMKTSSIGAQKWLGVLVE